MKTIVAKYNQTSLILRIAVGLIIGIILGIEERYVYRCQETG